MKSMTFFLEALRNKKTEAKKSTTLWRKELSFSTISEQLRRVRAQMVLYASIAMLGILITFILSHITKLPFSAHTRDMAAVLNVKETIGFLSNIGIIIWSFTTGICVFSAFVLKRSGSRFGIILFFLCSGILTFWFLLDDFFLFHDRMFPDYLSFPEPAIHLIYACITLAFIAAFFREILTTNYVLLILAGVFLAGSMSLDLFVDFNETENLYEDSLKFFGIIFWMGYFFNAGMQKVKG